MAQQARRSELDAEQRVGEVGELHGRAFRSHRVDEPPDGAVDDPGVVVSAVRSSETAVGAVIRKLVDTHAAQLDAHAEQVVDYESRLAAAQAHGAEGWDYYQQLRGRKIVRPALRVMRLLGR